MRNMDVLSKPAWTSFLLMAILIQGCSSHSHEMTAHQVKVNQDLANSWRAHGDEKVAMSFEERNRKLVEEDLDDYGLADFFIDILLGG